jgi:hypothetical protein
MRALPEGVPWLCAGDPRRLHRRSSSQRHPSFLVAARPARSAGFPVSQVIEAIKAEINEAAALASVRA